MHRVVILLTEHMRAQSRRAVALSSGHSRRSYEMPTGERSHHRTGTSIGCPKPRRRHGTTHSQPRSTAPGQGQLLINPFVSLILPPTPLVPSPFGRSKQAAVQGVSNGARRRDDALLSLRRLVAVLLRSRHRVDGVLLPGPEHDAGDADGRVGVRRRRGAAEVDEGGTGGHEREADAGGAGGGTGEARGRVAATQEPARGRQLVAAVPRRHRWAADEAGRVPGHGEAARRGRLPVRRRRATGAGGGFRGGDGAVRGREGTAAAAEGRSAAAARGRRVVVASQAPGAAHRHLQRRSGVGPGRSIAINSVSRDVYVKADWRMQFFFPADSFILLC